MSMRAALAWTLFWVGCALAFNGLLWVYHYFASGLLAANEKGLDFFTGYLIEKILSVDNLFVFYLIFQQFKFTPVQQRSVLLTGVWSAVILRLVLILTGIWLVGHFHWIFYVMGAFLILTGIRMILIRHEKEKDFRSGTIYRFLTRYLRVTDDYQGNRYIIRKAAVWYVTPMLIALILVEFSDLVFALDSIPAIFAITTDPVIVWTSNIFALMGLRSLYFLLAGTITRFSLLKHGIALILVFVGVKMIIEPWLAVPVTVSLAVIAGILLLFIGLSILKRT